MVNYKQYEDVVYEIIGAAMTVHRTLGSGLLEGERYAYIEEENLCCRLDKNMMFVD